MSIYMYLKRKFRRKFLFLSVILAWASFYYITSGYYVTVDVLEPIAKEMVHRKRLNLERDQLLHQTVHFNTTLAEEVSRKVRLLCFVLTRKQSLTTKGEAVMSTWGKRCDKIIFTLPSVLEQQNAVLVNDSFLLVNAPEGRKHLTAKSRSTFIYLYQNFLNDYDWFVKADDDTYLIVENLKFLLSLHDSNKPISFGRYFKRNIVNRTGYFSGGASYVVSREGLKLLNENGFQVNDRCEIDGPDEDVDISQCLAKSGVVAYKSVDKYERQTFLPWKLSTHVQGPVNAWLYKADAHTTRTGVDCCSQLTISYHYIAPDLMTIFELLLYRTSVFGRVQNVQQTKKIFNVESEKPLSEKNETHDDNLLSFLLFR